jgi:type I restriction enzyme, S subunit
MIEEDAPETPMFPWLATRGNWTTLRIKFAVKLINDRVEGSDVSLPYIGLESIESWTGRISTNDLATAEGQATLFQPGDILFGKLRPYLAKVFRAREPGICSTETFVVRPDDRVDPDFLAYFFLNRNFVDVVDGSTYGSKMPRANWEFFGNLPLMLPPIREQRAIATFLDERTAEIDALIAKKEQLLVLLAEKRQAIVTRAVTKGLDPTVPMKDTGIPWLGQIPAHWEVAVEFRLLALQDRWSFVNGPFGSDLLTSEILDEGVPVIYSGDVKQGPFVRRSNAYVSAEKARQLQFCTVGGSDLLLAKVGDPPGTATVYPTSEPPAIVTQDVVRVCLDPAKASAFYVAVLLNSAFGMAQIRRVMVEATRGRFPLFDLKLLRLPVPPVSEQRDIATAIAESDETQRTVESRIREAIRTLKELRSAEITAAVFGKRDRFRCR